MANMTSQLIISLIDRASGPARALDRTINSLTNASTANMLAMNRMRGQMVDAVAVGYALARAVAAPVEAAMEFESAIADVRKVTDFKEGGIEQFGGQLRRLAVTEIPMAVTELADLSAEAAAAGVASEDLLAFTTMTAKAAVAWGVTGGQAGEDLAKLQAALGLNIGETQLFADAINSLSDKTASSAPDLVAFARRVAAQGEVFGFTKEQTLAFGSAMVGTGAEVDVAATSFRNMGRALTKGTSATKRQQTAFKKLGLDAGKVAAGMQEDAVGTTLDVIERLGKVPEAMRAAVTSDLFGDEASALAPLLGNLGLLKETLGYVGDEASYAGSVSAEFAVRSATAQFAVQRFKNQLNELALAIGTALLPRLTQALDLLGPVVIAIADFAANNPDIVTSIFAVAGGLTALRIASIGTAFAFTFLKGGLIDTALLVARAGSLFLTVINPLNLVKNTVVALRTALLFSGVGLVIAGIAAAGIWIYNNWSGLTAFFQGFGTAFMAAIEPLMPVLQPVVDAGAKMLGWVTGLLGPIGQTDEAWKNWGTTVGTIVGGSIVAVVKGLGDIVGWFSRLPGEIGTAVGSMTSVGSAIIQGIWDGMVAKFNEMLDWFKSWPGLILSAIGKIDLSSLFQVPNLPFGGGGPAPAAGPSAVINGKVDPGLPAPPAVPAFAKGGPLREGWFMSGEEGPELGYAGGSGHVWNAAETDALLSGSRGNGSVSSRSLSIGDIHVSLGMMATSNPKAIARDIGNMVKSEIEAAFNDGGMA